MVRMLTLKDRREIERLWKLNLQAVEIAKQLHVAHCTIYVELRRGRMLDENGEALLDTNFRPAYSAEQGQKVLQNNLRRRGRRKNERSLDK